MCQSCGRRELQAPIDFVRAGAWPATWDVQRFQTVYDQQLFYDYQDLQESAPHISTSAWLTAVALRSRRYGGKVCTVLPSVQSACPSILEPLIEMMLITCLSLQLCLVHTAERLLTDFAGMQVEAIQQPSFMPAFLEWQHMQQDKRFVMQGLNDFVCPACYPAPHSLHVDANMKAFVWDHSRQPWRAAYHTGLLFQDSSEAVEHMTTVDALLGKHKVI